MDLLNFLTIDEVAQILHISRRTADRMAAKGKLPVIKVGRKILVERKDLEMFLSMSKKTQKNEQ